MKLLPLQPRTAQQSGLTFVDVIMATAVISIMSLGVVGSLTYGFFVMQMARENQRATQVMLEKVETLRLYNWDQVNSNGFIPTNFTDVYDPQASSGRQGVTYTGTLTIADFTNATSGSISAPPSYSTNMRQVTLTVNWNTRNINRSRSLTTYIARDGMQNYVY
jgi:type II secretory pathway pseudopilin PulG